RLDTAVNVKATAGVMKVDESTPSSLGDQAQRLLHEFVAVAGRRGEDVSRKAVGVDADEHGLIAYGVATANVAFYQREVAFAAVDFALVGDDPEFAVRSWQHAFGDAEDVAFILQAVADELGDGEHLQIVL